MASHTSQDQLNSQHDAPRAPVTRIETPFHQENSEEDAPQSSRPPSNTPSIQQNNQLHVPTPSQTRPNTPLVNGNSHQQTGSTLPYAFAAQFSAIQRQERILAAPSNPAFASQFDMIERQEDTLTQPSSPRLTFSLPTETHPESELAPRSPYIQLHQRQPYPRSRGTLSIIPRADTPALFPSVAERSLAAAAARPSLVRTPSDMPNPLGWTQDMNAVAVGLLETESIEKVLEHFIRQNPGMGNHQAIREHLQALLIQFHG